MGAANQGGGVSPKDLKQGEAATAAVKKSMQQVAKMASELEKLPPPSDEKAKKQYDALLKTLCKNAGVVVKQSALLKKKEEAARKALPKDQQKLVAGKLGKGVGEIDKLGAVIKKATTACQAKAKKGGTAKGGAGKGDDKSTLKKMHSANQAMGALGKQITASQRKILVAP